jgi:hypothetical protein
MRSTNVLCFAFIILAVIGMKAQDSSMTAPPVVNENVKMVFKDRKVINSATTEMLKAGKLDFRVSQRFGDISGTSGGPATFYGIDNPSDLGFGFDYGVSDNALIGVNRTKGSGPLRQNLNGQLKLRLITQKSEGSPVSLALMALGTYSTMKKSTIPGEFNFFESGLHRFSYHSELIISSKINNAFSIQTTGGFTYRNIVSNDDTNELLSIGVAARIQFTKAIGLILDGRLPVSDIRQELRYIPMGAGIEWETGGGHVFQLTVTNARGLAETDFIPYTDNDWKEGQFRIGFSVSRQFTLK